MPGVVCPVGPGLLRSGHPALGGRSPLGVSACAALHIVAQGVSAPLWPAVAPVRARWSPGFWRVMSAPMPPCHSAVGFRLSWVPDFPAPAPRCSLFSGPSLPRVVSSRRVGGPGAWCFLPRLRRIPAPELRCSRGSGRHPGRWPRVGPGSYPARGALSGAAAVLGFPCPAGWGPGGSRGPLGGGRLCLPARACAVVFVSSSRASLVLVPFAAFPPGSVGASLISGSLSAVGRSGQLCGLGAVTSPSLASSRC